MKHFILFFENRGPEIKNFANAFKEVEFSKDFNRLNQEIVPVLVGSLEKEIAKLTEKQSQEKVIKLFKITFTSFKQFYGEILKAYTVNGFLYKNLNRYLRNEDWIELDCLLPYAFCLCKAFLITELTSTYNNNQKQQLGGSDKITLYRGAILDEISLSFYDGQTIPNFSWNGVTSTTTDRRVAENFMAGNTDPSKIPVMFVIEVPITQDSLKNLSWIDIKPFSVYPIEEEIVLGPGSTFKLTSFSRDKKGAEVHLRLIPRVDTLAHQGQIMHGAMHAKMTTGLISKIVALEGNELMDAICHLKGNRLIEELEFNFCKYDANTLAKLIDILPTISNLRRLACFSLSSNDKTHMTDIIKGLKQLKIRTLEIYDRSFNVISFSNEIQHLTSLTDLNIDFTSFEQFSDSLVHDLGRKGIRHLTSLTTLSLKFPKQVTGWGLESIAQDLRQLISLKGLSLKVANREISHDRVMSLFTDALKHLTLETLSLDFSGCLVADKVLSALDPQELKHLQKLTTLNLNFTDTDASNEELKDFSAKRLRYLSSLKVLKLDFTNCEKISNIGVRDLWSEGISYLSSLTTLDLSFKEKRGWITGEGWENLLLNKTKNLSSLTSLNIVFQSCSIREDGLKNFSCGILKHLTSLTSLSLYFGHNNPAASIGDEEVKILCDEGIRHLASLTSLYLNFKNCQITNQGLGALSFEGIRYLTSLSTLSLNLDGCLEITDEGLKNLCFGGIKHLTALTTLSLSLNWLFRISDEGLKALCFEGIRYLTSLRMLSLDFSKCPEVSDEGLKSLFHDTIPNLVSLATLKLNCDRCLYVTEEFLNDVAQDKHLEVVLGYRDEITLSHNEQAISYNFKRHIKKESKNVRKPSIESVSPISDKIFTLYPIERLKKINGRPLEKDQIERIKSLKFDPRQYPDDEDPLELCFQGLQDFTSLTNLDLDFHECRGIPDEWFKSLYSEGLRHLTTLTTLKLNLNNCNIQDEGFKSLAEALTHLTSLATLDLDFSCVYGFDDTVFKDFCSRGIRSLTSLKCLCLNFNSSGDWDMKNLASGGLRYLTGLATLDLSFEDTRLTDAELKDLCTEGIRYLTSLTILKINYVKEYCSGDFKGVGDIGLKDLCVEGIRHLTSLKSLSLRLSAKQDLTDAGLKSFGTEGLRYMTWLTSLDLNFEDSDITSAGLKDLCTEGIRYLTSLTTLKLDLLIDNEGLKAIGSEGIKYLTKLDDLELDMNHPYKSSDISNEGLKILCSEGIRNLVSLTNLKIDFPECKNIDSEGFLILASEGFKHLSSLKTLTLNFQGCYEVKDDGLRSLCAEGIRHLTSLTTLNLRFCSYFTDEGLKNLGTEGLKYLTSLTALDLTFHSGKFTDEGLKSLCTEGIKYLKSLTTLDLTFNFGNITDEGLKDLCTEGIKYLTSLTTLYLNFENCNKFTEAGYKDLKMLLKYFGFYSLNYRSKHDR